MNCRPSSCPISARVPQGRGIAEDCFWAYPEFLQLDDFLLFESLYFMECIMMWSFLVSFRGLYWPKQESAGRFLPKMRVWGWMPKTPLVLPKLASRLCLGPYQTWKETENDQSMTLFVKCEPSMSETLQCRGCSARMRPLTALMDTPPSQ